MRSTAEEHAQASGQDVYAPVQQHDRAALGRYETPQPVGEAGVALKQRGDHVGPS
jgi:hypothetical protein